MFLEEVKNYTFPKNGIYVIFNSTNHHRYIGSSNKVKYRLQKHFRTEETKRKISVSVSNSIKGDKNPNFSVTFLFYHKKYGQEKCSNVELTNKYKLNYSKVCSICNGTRKTHSGWVCIK